MSERTPDAMDTSRKEWLQTRIAQIDERIAKLRPGNDYRRFQWTTERTQAIEELLKITDCYENANTAAEEAKNAPLDTVMDVESDDASSHEMAESRCAASLALKESNGGNSEHLKPGPTERALPNAVSL